ncbi:glycoside hydrolase family 2 protein [Lachnospiraceae bacterium ZAX-1]
MMIKQRLDNERWKFKDIRQDTWHTAVVPGTLFTDMMREGLLDNPYYRFHEKKLLPLAEQDYEYQCDFVATKDFLSRKNQFLVCEGIDTIASIYLNGHLIAKTDNMHRTYRIAVQEEIHAGNNQLRIVLYSPVNYIAKQYADDPLPEFNSASLHGFAQIRKIHSAFRWDAEPLVPDSGLWRSIYLEGYDAVYLQHVYVKQRHELPKVFLDIEVTVDITAGTSAKGCIKLLKPDGEQEYFKDIRVEHGKNKVTIEVSHPQLWWPNGYGAQPLYELEVSLKAETDETKLDSKKIKIGIREAAVRREKDTWGESFEIRINQVPVFAKGACYTPPDKFLTTCRGKRHEDLIKHCVAANYNCIRVWGGAVYPDDEFFELCDQYGLLVWQDLMFACALYHVTDEFVENVRAEVKDNVIRLRNHASLVLWCGSNENEWFHDYEHQSEGLTNELRMDNLRQYEVILKDVVHAYDPQRLYWPSSPSSGGGYEDPNGYAKGDVHCWYVWYLPAKPYTFYRECTGRFISEYGLESFQSTKTLRHYMEPQDMSPNSEVMDYMQHCSDNHCNMGNAKIVSYIFQEVRAPKDFEEYVYASQYAQAEGIKYGTAHWRRLKPRCMGTLYWQIVDCFPGTTWSGLDYEYRWKILHYYAKRFFQQVVISAEEPIQKSIGGEKNQNQVTLHVVNDNPYGFLATIDWYLKNNDGNVIRQGNEKVQIEKSSAKPFLALDFSHDLDDEKRRKTYLEFRLSDENGEIISSDTMLFVKPKHFAFLQPEICWQIAETKEAFEIIVKTSVYTKCIQLDFSNEEGVFSDNCFDLSPGQEKKITLEKESLSKQMTVAELKEELYNRNLNTIGIVVNIPSGS